MADRLTTVEAAIKALILAITPAGTVKQCEWQYISQPQLPSVELTWGGGPYNCDSNNTLDVALQFNARIKGHSQATVRTVFEALQVLFFDPASVAAYRTAGATNIQPFSLDPPIPFGGRTGVHICDIQFDIELGFTYP